MYRFWLSVCYRFLSRPDLFSTGPSSWNGLTLYSFPPHKERDHRSPLHLLRLFSPSPRLLVSCRPFPVTSFHEPHVVARPRIRPLPPWPKAARLSRRIWGVDRTNAGEPLRTGPAQHRCTTEWIKTSLSSGHFFPVHWKCNVTWSYA